MRQTAKSLRPEGPELEYAVVGRSEREELLVHTRRGPCPARRALSCLVAPEPGDTVLVSAGGAGRVYVLAVLDRPGGEGAATRLDFSGPVSLKAPRGLAVDCGEDLTLASRTRLGLASPEMEVRTLKAEIQAEETSFVGRVLHAQAEKIRCVAQSLDQTVRRLVQRLGWSCRYVEDHEEVQAGSMRQLVDGTLTVQTGNTVHTAEGHVKIDAEQIHLA